MQYCFSAQFLSDVVFLAKDIAYYQRGIHELQNVDVLQDKFAKELEELEETDHPIEEIVDVVYYALCLASQGENLHLSEIEHGLLKKYGFSQNQIEKATLAKYRLRASGPNSKNFELEREAIRAALAMMDLSSKRLFLFDRDGTLTMPASGERFPKSVDDQQWMPGRLECLQYLHKQGKKTAIVTNQGGAAWEIFEPDDMCEQLGKQCSEGFINAFFVCFHDTSEKAKQKARIQDFTGDKEYQGYAAIYKGYHRRKPSPGMLIEAMDHFKISNEDTLYIGDRDEDREAAKAADVDFMWSDEFFS